MTAPTIVSGATSNFNTSNSLTLAVNTPTYAAGDEIFVAWATDGDSATATIDSSGWTTMRGPITISGGAIGVFYLWRKTAGSEPSTYTVTTSVLERSAIAAFAVRNFNGIHAEATDNSGSTSTATVNALTTSITDTLRISIVAAASDRSPVGSMSGHTEIITVAGTSAGTISIGYKALAASGTDGSFTVTLGATGWVSSAFAIAPTSGAAQNVTAGTIASGSSVYAPTVHHTVTAGTISSSATVHAPTATRGAVVVTTDQIGSGAASYAPVVSATYAIAADALAASGSVYTPTVTVGAVDLAPAFVAAGAVVPAPVVAAIYSVLPEVIESGAVVHAPTATQGSSTIFPDLLDGGGTLYSPTVTPGAAVIAPDSIASTVVIYNQTVIGGSQAVTPDFIVSGVVIAAPLVLPIPTFIGSASALSATSVTSRAPAVPANTADGDLMIALVMVELESPGITPPDGWTLLWNSPITGRTHSQAVYYRVAASEPGSYTWSWTSAEGGAAIVTYRNSALPTLYGYQINNTQSGSVTAPSLTITANGSVAVWLATIMSGSTFTPPANYTERVDLRTAIGSTQMGMSIAERFFQVAAATGAPVGTGSNPDYSIGAQIILAPTSANLSQNVQPNTIAASSALYAPVTTPAAITISPPLVAGNGSVSTPTISYTLTAGMVGSAASVHVPSITVGAVGLTAAFIGATTNVSLPEIKSRATIGGVLYQDPTNGRYLRTTGGIVVLSGFHTWYTLWDGGVVDPPPAFEYTAWLDFVAGHGTNWHRFWAMESARDWDDAVAYFSDHYYARPGPATAADGKPRFDVTQLNQSYFDRLRERVIQAGNRGHYVTVQLFQGEQLSQSGETVGTPWAYHPFKSGNNINGISGDLNADNDGREVHSVSASAAIITAQRLYVAKVLDTLNDLDNVLYEIGTGDVSLANSKQWQWDLVDYCQTYEASLAKQHPVGMSAISGATVSDLTGSGADWISHSNGGSTATPLAADGTYVSLWDTGQVAGLVYEHTWVWKSFLRGNNPQFLDEYDGSGGRYGTDYRNNSISERIRSNLGYVLTFGARIDLENAVPQGALASTGYCLARTTGVTQMLIYQPASGSFTVDLASLPGLYSVEWLRTQTGATQNGANISGGATLTLSPPWASEDAVVYLLKIAEQLTPALIAGSGGVFAPVVTRGSVNVVAGTISASEVVRDLTVTVGDVTVIVDSISSAGGVFAPVVTSGSVAITVDTISTDETLFTFAVTVSSTTIAVESIGDTFAIYDPVVAPAAVSIAAGMATSVGAVYAPRTQRGPVQYSPDLVSGAETHYAPTLTVGAATVYPDTIADTTAYFEPVITPASWSLAFDSIPDGATVFAPTVVPVPWEITAEFITTDAIVHDIGVAAGAVSVVFAYIDSLVVVNAPTVTVATVFVECHQLATTATVHAPTVTRGAVALSVERIVAASQTYAPDVTKGAAYILPPSVAGTSVVRAPILTTSAYIAPDFPSANVAFYVPVVTARNVIAPSRVSGSATVFAPTVTRGAVSLVLGLATSSGSVPVPMVTRGPVYVTAGTIVGSSQVYAVDAYNVTFYVTANFLANGGGQIFAPTVTPGAATIVPDAIGSALAFYSATVTPWTALLYINALNSSAQVFQPIVTVGALTAAPDFLALTPAVRRPTVTRGAVAVTPPFIGGASLVNDVAVSAGILLRPEHVGTVATIFAPEVTRGARTVAAPFIASGAVVLSPTVSPWTALLTANAIGASSTVYAPAVSLPPYAIAASFIASGAVLPLPRVIRGYVHVTLDVIASASQVYTVTAAHGLRQYVYANSLSLSSQVYAAVIMALLAQRVRRVGREDRTLNVPRNTRGERMYSIE